MLEKIMGSIKLGRPINAIMVFFSVLIGAALADVPPQKAILPAISATLISMGAQAINDYFDVEIDKRKDRDVIIGKILSEGETYRVVLLYYLLGILLALIASPAHFLIALIISALTYIYSWKMGRIKYVGNIVVSLAVAISLIYGGIGGKVENTILPALIAFLANWGREILKDVSDGEADKGFKVSLYHVLGPKWATFFGSYLAFLAVILVPFPLLLGEVGELYTPTMAIASLVVLYAVARSLQGHVEEGERIVKVGMMIALVAFLAGAIS